MCETVGGEIIRAINRLGYRWWNDGDKFFVGYGVETCGSDALLIWQIKDLKIKLVK